MIPKDKELAFTSKGVSLSVGNVLGGDVTFPVGQSKIDAPDFRLALIEALRQSNLFTEVLSNAEADYELTATILTQDQPVVGLAMTVDLAVKYVLTNRETREEIFDERLASSYKAGLGEAFVGTTRVRKANEGAVRENIKQLLQQLSELPL